VFAAAQAQLGPVDILVNNAGISASMKLAETPDEVWEQIMRVNVGGAFACCKAALPEMIARQWGRIINIASIAGLQGMPFGAAYSASKHAMVGLTRSLAGELGRYDITCNAICPGWTDTDMLASFIDSLVAKTGRAPAAAQAALLASGRQKRLIAPEEVAAAVLRLASPTSEANGETVVIV
ncbi:MAG: SDR family oxidoreductase, partial [Chloroflexales bacterium]|nr:SDR family oxidoreductase [Chloroflexales bacterium]